MSMQSDIVVVGAGAAGAVVASRLSEVPGLSVILLEAGRDLPPGKESASIRDIYTFSAAFDPANHWPELVVDLTGADRRRVHYEQARLVGGGTSMNGLQAAIGTPADYDGWAADGLDGWSYDDVAPTFARLLGERFPIARVPDNAWPPFTRQATQEFSAGGFRRLADPNTEAGDGWFAIPFMSDGTHRISAAMAYLGSEVRARPNLRIEPHLEATRIMFEGRKVIGVEAVTSDGERLRIACQRVVVTAGALGSPLLLQHSGIGPEECIRAAGIPVVAHLEGVGENLQEHPSIAISALLASGMAQGMEPRRHILAGLRFSSTPEAAGDLFMVVVNRAAWHAVGWRIASLFSWVNKPQSRGHVRLTAAAPDISLGLLSDQRDLIGLAKALSLSFRTLQGLRQRGVVSDIILPEANAAFRAFLRETRWRALLMQATAWSIDHLPLARRAFRAQFSEAATSLPDLIRIDDETAAFLRDRVVPGWHPVGTCRMGAVVSARDGAVNGIGGLHVADASVMPVIPRANTALPTMMVAERLAEGIRKTIHAKKEAI